MSANYFFLLFAGSVFTATLLILSPVKAQQILENRAGIALSTTANAYRGDLGDGYEKWTAAFSLSYYFKHQRRLHGSLHAGFGTITGQASSEQNTDIITPSPTPNRFFTTNFISVNYGLQYDFIRGKHWAVYISQGFGIIRFNPQDQFYNNLQDNLQSRALNENYTNVAVILPTQLGFTYAFQNQFGLGLRTGFTNPVTDYLDNISQLGTKEGNDNILSFSFSFFVPVGKPQDK